MKIEKCIKITATDKKGKNIIFTTPFDFDLTDEYIQDKVNNKEKTAAEEWLKAKGFIEEPRGWSFYGDGTKDLKLGPILRDDKLFDLRVKLHRIEGIRYFEFPNAWSSEFRLNGYRSFNNFPDYIDTNKSIDIDYIKDSELEFYLNKSKSKDLLSNNNNNLKLDDHYLLYLAKNDMYHKMLGLNSKRFQFDLLKELNPRIYNMFKSAKSINKFQL